MLLEEDVHYIKKLFDAKDSFSVIIGLIFDAPGEMEMKPSKAQSAKTWKTIKSLYSAQMKIESKCERQQGLARKNLVFT